MCTYYSNFGFFLCVCVCVSFSYKVDVFTNNTSGLQDIGMSTFLASGVQCHVLNHCLQVWGIYFPFLISIFFYFTGYNCQLILFCVFWSFHNVHIRSKKNISMSTFLSYGVSMCGHSFFAFQFKFLFYLAEYICQNILV